MVNQTRTHKERERDRVGAVDHLLSHMHSDTHAQRWRAPEWMEPHAGGKQDEGMSFVGRNCFIIISRPLQVFFRVFSTPIVSTLRYYFSSVSLHTAFVYRSKCLSTRPSSYPSTYVFSCFVFFQRVFMSPPTFPSCPQRHQYLNLFLPPWTLAVQPPTLD